MKILHLVLDIAVPDTCNSQDFVEGVDVALGASEHLLESEYLLRLNDEESVPEIKDPGGDMDVDDITAWQQREHSDGDDTEVDETTEWCLAARKALEEKQR